MNEQALVWLNKQLRKKNIALHIATHKPNPSESEINDIQSAIDVLEYLIQFITKGT